MKLINRTLQKSYEIWNGVIVGRTQGGIKFPLSKELSAQHFRIHTDGGNFLLEDLGSKNGTFLEEVQLRGHKPVGIQVGMGFRAGEYEFELSDRGVILSGDQEEDATKPGMRRAFLATALIVLLISWSSYELSRFMDEFVPEWVAWMASLTSLGALLLCVSLWRRNRSWTEKFFFASGIHLVITFALYGFEQNHFSSEPISSAKLPLFFSKPLISYLENQGNLSQKYALTVAYDLARMKRLQRHFLRSRAEICPGGLTSDCWNREFSKIHALSPWSLPALGRASALLNDLLQEEGKDARAILERRFKSWVGLGELLLTSMDVKTLEKLSATGGALDQEKKLLSLHLLENIKYFQYQLLTETDLLEAQLKTAPSTTTASAMATYAALKQKIGWPNPAFDTELKEIRKALEQAESR